MPIDLVRARRDTPGTAQVLHFNNAGAALPPTCVVEAQTAPLELEARIGGYETADRERPRWERAYDAIAVLIGCRRDEVTRTACSISTRCGACWTRASGWCVSPTRPATADW